MKAKHPPTIPDNGSKHSRFAAVIAIVSLGLTIGCGDKQTPAPEPASQVSSEWTPVKVAEAPEETASRQPAGAPLLAPNNDAQGTQREMIARAQAPAMKTKADELRKQTFRGTTPEGKKVQKEQEAIAIVQAQAKSKAKAAELALQKAQADGATKAAPAQSPTTPPTPQLPPPAAQEVMSKGRTLQSELMMIVTKLRATHTKALEDSDVAKKKNALEEAAIKEIAKIAPGIETEWKRLKELLKELDNNPELAANDPSKVSAETRAKFEEFQTLTQKIEPLQIKVADRPEIKKLRDIFANAVESEVRRLEPQFDKLKARHDVIVEELRDLQSEFMKLRQQGGFTAAPPTPSAPSAPTPQRQ